MEELHKKLLAKVAEIRTTDSQELKDKACVRHGAQLRFPFDYDSTRKLIEDTPPFVVSASRVISRHSIEPSALDNYMECICQYVN